MFTDIFVCMCMTHATKIVFLDGENKKHHIINIYVHKYICMHVHDTCNMNCSFRQRKKKKLYC